MTILAPRRVGFRAAAALAVAFLCVVGCRTTRPLRRDGTVLVYGATASGVVAAVAAAREGKRVLLLEPTKHVGGMTSGGLGFTDAGAPETIGGIAREFYERVGAAYGLPVAFTFEPHVAEAVLRAMLMEARVTLTTEARIASVEKSAAHIDSVTTTDGRKHEADFFIDATYEGDLMALAKVTYFVGREGNARYGETLNGVTAAATPPIHVDPYVVPGVPSSGLVPHVTAGPLEEPGSADSRVQAYNYRLCITRNPAIRIPIAPPASYDPAEYELLARYLEALVAAGSSPNLGTLLALGMLPNEKVDANNSGFFSTDLIGGSDAYPDASEDDRAAIRARHEAYIRGFFHFLATSPRVPPTVGALAAEYGLCKDEFVETGGWPPQIYVREGRRMVGRYVMTEHDVRKAIPTPQPVGLASYSMDSHYTRRVAVAGEARNEGGFDSGPPGPFAIAYGALTPPTSQAVNLLVPVCLSASHVAYGSIRMEPVFMILGHAAGVAAAVALDQDAPVQTIDYFALRDRLLATGQRLSWP